MFFQGLFVLSLMLQTGLAQNCDWDPSTDPNQGLHPDSLGAGARYLGQMQEVSNPEICRGACCQEADCDLAVVGQPADGGLQCMLVSCGSGGCTLQHSSQFQVFRRTGRSEAGQEAATPGKKLHVVPLLEAEEPRSNETNSDLCRLEKKTGPCRAAFPRFFYNVTSQTCSSFIFGGCEPNGNNFASQEDCEAACSGVTGSVLIESPTTSAPPPPAPKAPRMAPAESGPAESGPAESGPAESGPAESGPAESALLQKADIQADEYAELCEAEYQTGPCRAAMKRWFYNKEKGSCQTFIYGGCKGNKNNYRSEESCKSTCTGVKVLPSSKKNPEDDKSRCSLSPESGMCRAAFPKFYYDPSSASCQTFVYGGCGGNGNKFDSLEECMTACSGDGSYESHGKSRNRWTAAFFLFVTLAVISALLLATVIIITLRRHRRPRRYSSVSDKRGLIPDSDEMSSQDSLSIPESPTPKA
uniref:Kunitz-type serine protease inhibitor 6 n=1 Tax=Fundulus heteroclitus TaxID=8078 RepID=A0A3Q2TBH4_FUNHE